MTDRQLSAWVSQGLLSAPMKGVFHAAQLSDGITLRLACLRLVVPETAVVTGRTAGWLHGAPMILAPGDHLKVPQVEMHLGPGNRLRNALACGGERTFLPHEIVVLDGVRVTGKLRTTVDLGRCLWREQAFAAMCAMLKVADFDRDELRHEIRERGRFAGYRGIRQARALEPMVDDRFGSPAECLLGLGWWDAGNLPAFVPQHPVVGPDGMFYLDLAVPELKYAAEYRGKRWHGHDRVVPDAARLDWLVEHDDWIVDNFEDQDLFGRGADPTPRLRAGVERARRRFGGLSWTGQNRYGESWLG